MVGRDNATQKSTKAIALCSSRTKIGEIGNLAESFSANLLRNTLRSNHRALRRACRLDEAPKEVDNMKEEEVDKAWDAQTTLVSFGLVLRLPLEMVPHFKTHLKEFYGCEIIYQKISPGKLWIKAEGDG